MDVPQTHNITRIGTVEEWDRPDDTSDDPNVNWIAVRVGRAAPQSQFGQRINAYDLQNGAQELPWTAREWVDKLVRDTVSGLPLQVDHKVETGGGALNRTFVDPADQSLLVGAYVHSGTPNGRAILEGLRTGELKEASINYDAKTDPVGRLLSCRVREVSMTRRGRIPGSTIRVLNSADVEQPTPETTKPPMPAKNTFTKCIPTTPQAKMSSTDSAPAAAAATTAGGPTRPVDPTPSPPASSSSETMSIDTSDIGRAVEQWIDMPIEERLRVPRSVQNEIMYEMEKFTRQGKEAVERERRAQEAEHRRIEEEGKARFDRYRGALSAGAKRAGVEIDGNEQAESGLLAMFNRPETQFYANVVGGVVDELEELKAALARSEEQKEMLLGAVRSSGRQIPVARAATPRDDAPTIKRRATEAPAQQQQQRQSQPTDTRQSAPEPEAPRNYRDQLVSKATIGQLPAIRMNKSINNGVGFLVDRSRDPNYIDPTGIHMLSSKMSGQISVQNSASSQLSHVLAQAVQDRVKSEPAPSSSSTQLGPGAGANIISNGYFAQLPNMSELNARVKTYLKI